MLDHVFAAARWKAALAAAAVLAVSAYAISNYSPKNVIAGELGGAYVSTDNPRDTEETLFWYETSRVTGMLKLYEPRHYVAHESFVLCCDLFFPVFYAVPLVVLLAFLYPWRGGPRLLVLAPLAIMVFDYAENFTMLAFLRSFRADPQTPLWLLELSRAFTVLKLALFLLTFALLAVFLVASVVGLLRARTGAP